MHSHSIKIHHHNLWKQSFSYRYAPVFRQFVMNSGFRILTFRSFRARLTFSVSALAVIKRQKSSGSLRILAPICSASFSSSAFLGWGTSMATFLLWKCLTCIFELSLSDSLTPLSFSACLCASSQAEFTQANTDLTFSKSTLLYSLGSGSLASLGGMTRTTSSIFSSRIMSRLLAYIAFLMFSSSLSLVFLRSEKTATLDSLVLQAIWCGDLPGSSKKSLQGLCFFLSSEGSSFLPFSSYFSPLTSMQTMPAVSSFPPARATLILDVTRFFSLQSVMTILGPYLPSKYSVTEVSSLSFSPKSWKMANLVAPLGLISMQCTMDLAFNLISNSNLSVMFSARKPSEFFWQMLSIFPNRKYCSFFTMWQSKLSPLIYYYSNHKTPPFPPLPATPLSLFFPTENEQQLQHFPDQRSKPAERKGTSGAGEGGGLGLGGRGDSVYF